MPVILYRRHTKRCPTQIAGRKEFKLSHRAKREYMGCDCPLWVAGKNLAGEPLRRESLGTTDLEAAKAIVAAELKTAVAPQPAQDRGPKLPDCIVQYLERREHEISDSTRYHYKWLLGELQVYAGRNGITYVRDLSPDLLERFKFEGLPKKMKDSSRGMYTAKMRAFLREAERLGWIEARLADRVRPHHHEHESTLPFEETEIAKMFAAAPRIFRLLFQLMLETGLRISDAMRFDPAQLIKGEHLWIYPFRMAKRKRLARPQVVRFEVFISDGLKTAIDEAKTEWGSPNLPFWFYPNARATYKQIYREMQRIGEECGIADCRPHRLRDSFAVRKLLAGLSLDDVSRLLGHASVSMTEQAYAAWVPARARRLEGIVAATLLSAPLMDAPSNLHRNA